MWHEGKVFFAGTRVLGGREIPLGQICGSIILDSEKPEDLLKKAAFFAYEEEPILLLFFSRELTLESVWIHPAGRALIQYRLGIYAEELAEVWARCSEEEIVAALRVAPFVYEPHFVAHQWEWPAEDESLWWALVERAQNDYALFVANLFFFSENYFYLSPEGKGSVIDPLALAHFIRSPRLAPFVKMILEERTYWFTPGKGLIHISTQKSHFPTVEREPYLATLQERLLEALCYPWTF